MSYPTLLEIEKAGREQLARWYRFLPSPSNVLEHSLMLAITNRFLLLGGFTPELSKKIGLEP